MAGAAPLPAPVPPSVAAAERVRAASVAAAVAAAAAERADAALRVARAEAALGGTDGLITDVAPSKDPPAADPPATPESAASGLGPPWMYKPIDSLAPLSFEAEQAAAVAMRGVDPGVNPLSYLDRKLVDISASTDRDLSEFLNMDPDVTTLLGDADDASGPMANPAKPRPFGETSKKCPGWDTPIKAELDVSMYSSGDGGRGGGGGSCVGGGGAGSDKKRKTIGSDGNDNAGGGNKKICTASIAGDITTSTYSGGGGSGSCNKRKGGSSDGYNYAGGPNKKVCCA